VKTDSLFYQLFSQSPSLLFELLGDTNPRASTYGFGSQEVKQTSFRIDGILTPPPYAVDLPIYFLEVQGYKDREGNLYPTFFGEIFLYLNDYRPSNDWKAVLIFTERRFDPGVPIHYQDFVQTGRLQRIYLDALPDELETHSLEWGIVQLIGVKKKSAPEKARQLIERAQRELTDVTSQQKLLELITKADRL
jgi:predicted transposase YdaD